VKAVTARPPAAHDASVSDSAEAPSRIARLKSTITDLLAENAALKARLGAPTDGHGL
jgi:hypothetical protein